MAFLGLSLSLKGLGAFQWLGSLVFPCLSVILHWLGSFFASVCNDLQRAGVLWFSLSFADSPSGMLSCFLQVFCNARHRFGKSRWAASVENLIFSYMKQQPPRSPKASLRLFVVLLCSLPFASCSLFFCSLFFSPGLSLIFKGLGALQWFWSCVFP